MKVQSTVLNLSKKEGMRFSWSDGWLGISGFFLGLLSLGSLAISFITILSAYFYHRAPQKTLLCGAGFLMGSLIHGPWNLYFNAVLLCIFALMIAFVRLLKGNIYTFFPVMSAMVTLISAMILNDDIIMGFQAMLLSYVLCLVALKHMNAAQNLFRMNGLILGILLLSISGALHVWLSGTVEVLFLILIYALLAQLLDMGSLLLLMLAGYGLFTMPQYLAGWTVGLILCNSMKECGKGAQLFGFALPLALTSARFDVLFTAILIFILAAMMCTTSLPLLIETANDEQFERLQIASQKRLLEHQLNQFAQIFHLITQFFKTAHPTESTFMQGMARSMELLSMQLKESSSSTQDETMKIYNLLKGYNYPITRVHVSETELGQKRIELMLEECSRQDLEEVILPLLQMVIDRNLRIIQFTNSRFLKSSVKIELCGTIPLQFKAQVFKIRKLEEASGDTCGMFQVRQNTICTLSDGMGAGKTAERSSSFVTQLTQRLLAAGIPVEMAVKSMNSLLRMHQEESFATLDVLIFDALSRQAYLSKSGACATFLVRHHQVLKIQGESLPLGIVQQVEADCYKMDCLPDDLFVMCSDGIEESELERWLLEGERGNIHAMMEEKMAQLDTQDDATVLLAEVLKR